MLAVNKNKTVVLSGFANAGAAVKKTKNGFVMDSYKMKKRIEKVCVDTKERKDKKTVRVSELIEGVKKKSDGRE